MPFNDNVNIEFNEVGGRTVVRTFEDIGNAANRSARPVDGFNGGLDRTSQSAQIASSAIKTLVIGFGALKLAQKAKEAATLSQRYQELGIVLNVVGKNAGFTAREVNLTAEAVRKQGISMVESRQIVARLIQANIDLSKATNLARLAQDAAVIGQVNSSEALNRLVFGITSAQVEVLRGIGINVSFEQSYARLAKEIGVSQNALTEQQKLQARLNVVLEQGDVLTGVYTASLDNAGKQMRSNERRVDDLKVKIGGLFDSTAQLAVREYTRGLVALDESVTSLGENRGIVQLGDNIALVFATIGDAVRANISLINIFGQAVTTRLQQAQAVFNFDFAKAAQLENELAFAIGKEAAQVRRLRDELLLANRERDRQAESAKLQESIDAENASMVKLNQEFQKLSERRGEDTRISKDQLKINEKLVSDRRAFIQGLRLETEAVGKDSFQLRELEAARLGILSQAEPLIQKLRLETEAFEEQQEVLKLYQEDVKRIEQLTEQNRTPLQRFQATKQELDVLKNLGLSQETYTRALTKAQTELFKTQVAGLEAYNQLDQFAVQAARNIQTSFADFLFDPFDKGVEGMAKGFFNALRRMAAEAASVSLINATGIGAALGLQGRTSSGGQGLQLANLGLTAANLFSSGFGGTALAGSAISGLGRLTGSGTLSAFGAGFGGDTIAGVAAGTSAGLSGSAAASTATLGQSVASFAGPAIAVLVADQVLKGIFGDKKLGGTAGDVLSFVPVVGTIINGLFGRGQLKFRDQTLLGDVTPSGFSGAISSRFKASGGLLRGSKTDNVITDLSSGTLINQIKDINEGGISGKLLPFADNQSQAAIQLGNLLNQSFKGISTSLRDTAKLLDLDTTSLDSFNTELRITSEKGEQLTDQKISEEISRISDEMIRALIPSIDKLTVSGEPLSATLLRIGQDFTALESALRLVGQSSEDAQEILRGMSFTQRATLTNLAGGAEALATKTQSFFDNVLTDAQKLEILSQDALAVLKQFGVEFVPTIAQLSEAVRSGGLNARQFAAALDIQPLLTEIERLRTSTGQLTDSTAQLEGAERSLLQLRNDLNAAYTQEASNLESVVRRFKDFAQTIGDFRRGLLISDISPLTPGQRLSEARTQFNRTRSAALSGDENALQSLPQVAQAFLEASRTFNASSPAFVSDFSIVQATLEKAEIAALDQVDVAEQQLSKLKDSVSHLIRIDDGVKSVEVAIRDLTAAVLQGGGNLGISKTQIQEAISSANGNVSTAINNLVGLGVNAQQISDATGASLTQIGKITGGLSITDDQIRQFVFTEGRTNMQVYNAAIAAGISSSRLASATGVPVDSILAWVRKNNLAEFELGTDMVPRNGMAFLHKGEAVSPAGMGDEIVAALREEMSKLRGTQTSSAQGIGQAVIEAVKQVTDSFISELRDIERDRVWNNKKVGT